MSRIASVYGAILAAKTIAALRRRTPPAGDPGPLDHVWVVQPILSGDPDLPAALAENAVALAGARLLWMVDDDDPAGQRAAEAAATSDCQVVVCDPAPDGVNPKLWKLQRAWEIMEETAPPDAVFVVLDDDTRLPLASLGALLRGLVEPDAGDQVTVSTGLPAYLPTADPWGRLVQQFVVNNAALTYLSITPVTLNGMTYALRARHLRELGGFTALFGSLTDDLAVARAVLGAGGRIVQTASPQWITTAVGSGGRYVALMHRWFLFADLLLRRQPPLTAGKIALLHGVPPLLLWAVVLRARRRPVAAVLTLAARAGVLAWVQHRFYGRVLHAPVASVVAELAQPVHLAHASVQRTITWRSRTYVVRADDDFAAVR